MKNGGGSIEITQEREPLSLTLKPRRQHILVVGYYEPPDGCGSLVLIYLHTRMAGLALPTTATRSDGMSQAQPPSSPA